jgi:hypothetical protein
MLIDDCLDSYDKASKEQKTKIAQEIVGIVHHAGGRFLKDDGAGWAQVTNIHVLRQKVAHAFRGLRSQKQTQSSYATKEKQDSIVSQVHPDPFMPGRDDIAVAADTLVDTKPPPVHSQQGVSSEYCASMSI